MANHRLDLHIRFPHALLLLALVAATSFFVGALWQANQGNSPLVTDDATPSATTDFRSSVVLAEGSATITSVDRSGQTMICAQAGMGTGCSAVDAAKPLTVASGTDGETSIAVVDPRRRIASVVVKFGNQQVDLPSQDGGLSVSATLSREPDSFFPVDSDGHDLTSPQ